MSQKQPTKDAKIKSKGSSFFKVIKITALSLIFLIVSLIGFSFASNQSDFDQRIKQLSQDLNTIQEENASIRNFAYESCLNDAVLSEYLGAEVDSDCGRFYDVEETGVKVSTPEEIFIDLFTTFVYEPEANANLIEKMFAENIYQNPLEVEDTRATDPETIAAKKQALIELYENPQVHSYLADFQSGYTFEKTPDGLYQLQQNDEVLINIYLDDFLGIIANLLTYEKFIAFDDYDELTRKGKYLASQYSDFDIKAFIEQADAINEENLEMENFLLLGRNGGNVDTIILTNIDHTNQNITLVSIPRDLWVDSRKINSFWTIYGMDFFISKLEKITGREISGYVLVEMMAFAEVVDALGGVEFEFTKPLIDPTYRVKNDGVWSTLYYPTGKYSLNGIESLRVARSRYTTSDFARAKRQQELLKSIKSKVDQVGKLNALVKLIKPIMNNVETDLELYEIAKKLIDVKDYDFRVGKVMTSGNVLASQMLEISEDKKAYILQPRGGWQVVQSFITTAINEE
jgi:LCP family protein required for cell wall assembly